MDVETEIPFPCTSSRNGFASAKRPRTDEGAAHEHQNLISRDEFERRSENSLFFNKRPDLSTDYSTTTSVSPKRFLLISASGLVYESEDFRPKGETLYTPLQEDVIINTRNIEQFTFTNGSFFIGDESSRFSRTVQGVSLNMWRFDDQTIKKLYISRSFVFTNTQEAQDIKRVLEAM
ncbi:hypothetical protein OS493_036208 [Desmophyllum pertusum]|uniref:Uncharacterized protein n=1 Tax=Desmophyllum pertusum TaxID=174260 RepID=A0A9W9YIA0_9CNID|nr:hypothetical protein OS493_036208 [Desmophyllum pertusum]